ncbi:LLM class F420-dependent oxidoreductase [Sporichthya brevicatena]|uniref:LLM class F420-dependent oxidoreductase n=1 Tax=Sporichthya brevicatena TaxID=171442 RepID=A0ABN1H705_9ACTN
MSVFPRPFRFGVISLGNHARPAWEDFARRLEATGFAVLHVPQHFSLPVAPAIPALALAAGVTSTLTLSTLVLDNEVTHPTVVARDASWLAAMSDGRFELGLGAGWLPADHEVIDAPWRPAAERVDRVEEALAILRAYGDGPLDFDGKHYRVRGLENVPVPHTHRIPLLLGAGGPRMLRLAAAHADIVGITPRIRAGRVDRAAARSMTLDAVLDRIDVLRETAGPRFADLELHLTLTAVIDPADTDRLERTADAFGTTVEGLRDVPTVLVGDPADMADQLRVLRERTGITYISAFEDVARRLEPVLNLL